MSNNVRDLVRVPHKKPYVYRAANLYDPVIIIISAFLVVARTEHDCKYYKPCFTTRVPPAGIRGYRNGGEQPDTVSGPRNVPVNINDLVTPAAIDREDESTIVEVSHKGETSTI